MENTFETAANLEADCAITAGPLSPYHRVLIQRTYTVRVESIYGPAVLTLLPSEAYSLFCSLGAELGIDTGAKPNPPISA